MYTMSTTRRTLLALAAIGTLTTGITATSTAAGAKVDDARLGDTKPATVNDFDVETAAKQFGWEVDATAKHLNAQFEFGLLIDSIATKYPESYAGASFAEEPGATSHIMIKGTTPGDVDKAVESSGQNVKIVAGMRYSEQDQRSRADQIVTHLNKAGFEDVGTAVLSSGEIQVAVSGKGKDVQLPRHLSDNVKVVQAPGPVVVDEAAKGGQKIFGNGFQCTSGFSVRRISDGRKGIATAGHCTGMNTIETPNQRSMSWQAQHRGSLGDLEWHTTSATEIDNYMARPNEERDVSMVWPANGFAENMTTCVFSRMQGTRSCDRIFSTSVTAGGDSDLIATDGDATVGGDSGGPWSFNSIADGIHKGDVFLSSSWRNMFSRAANLPAALGVEVMT